MAVALNEFDTDAFALRDQKAASGYIGELRRPQTGVSDRTLSTATPYTQGVSLGLPSSQGGRPGAAATGPVPTLDINKLKARDAEER